MKHTAACCCLLLAACATPPETGMDRAPVKGVGAPASGAGTQASPADPTLDLFEKLRSSAPTAPVADAEDAAFMGQPGAPARTLSCLLPRDIATDRAWKLTDETLLPPEKRALWHANGLRLGLLPEAKWEEFRGALNLAEKGAAKTNSGVLSQETSTFTLRAWPEALRKGGRMPGKVALPMDTTLPPFAPSGTSFTAFEGDRVQLMATGMFSGTGFAGLTLAPHLYHPQSLLGENLRTLDAEGRPRMLKPWEKEAQGQTIAALATPALRPPKGQVLVVGLWWPWKKPDAQVLAENDKADEFARLKAKEAAEKKDGKKPEKDTDKKEDKKQDPEDLHLLSSPPPMPFTLGQALFTLTQGEGEYQVIVVIGVK